MIARPMLRTATLIFLAAVVFSGVFYAAYRTVHGSRISTPPPLSLFKVPLPTDQAMGSWPALQNANFFAETKKSFIEAKASFMEADLTAMTLKVYKDGEVIKEVPIRTKGREGSWWETPAGLYRIEAKDTRHFSKFGGVYQPWSMVFQGNFFIHGWPYYPDGTPVSSLYSGGCIRLSTDDAKAVYALAEIGMPVLVYQKDFGTDDFGYMPKVVSADVSAKEYLAADLKNNFVFLGADTRGGAPVASIVKLMTALVAAEYINLDKEITVPKEAAVFTSRPRLQPGDKVSAYQLLYPLLQESSNEAAVTLASAVGRDYFVNLMNKKAAALGMVNTHFADPAGVSPENISTAEDLFLFAKYLLNNRSFILKITSGTVGANAYGPSEFKDLNNFNVFAGQANFLGGKVGETEQAGQTMLAIWNENLGGEVRPMVIVVLGSKDKITDVNAIRDTVIKNYQ